MVIKAEARVFNANHTFMKSYDIIWLLDSFYRQACEELGRLPICFPHSAGCLQLKLPHVFVKVITSQFKIPSLFKLYFFPFFSVHPTLFRALFSDTLLCLCIKKV